MVVNKIVITLTTVPERLNYDVDDGFTFVLKSLCEQNHDNYEVHLNLPYIYMITGKEYNVPTWIEMYQELYSHLKVFRVEDIGPPTKVIPTIIRESPETLIIVVDDDLIYHADMINEHVKFHKHLDNSVILYDGRNLVTPKYNDLRDAWVLTVSEISRVKQLQHYKSASYFKKYFDDDFFTDFVGKTKSDDILMSYYFNHKGIKMFVVPYEPDIEHIKTYNEWYTYQGVTTFPVIRHSNSLGNTGCNHPDMLKIEPKFFLPDDFKKIRIVS